MECIITLSKTLTLTRLLLSKSRPIQKRGVFVIGKNILHNKSRVNNRVASFCSSGGGNGSGFSHGGPGGGDNSNHDKGNTVVSRGAEEGSGLSPDVIILDVAGMTCGGCAASVKRILENQPHVASASVNLATETAIVWPDAEAKVMPYWQKQIGEALAKHLTSCGFKSNIRGRGAMEEVL